MTTQHEQLVILDFDSTLFSVEQFIEDLPKVIEEQCGIPAERYHATYEEAKKASGSYSIYDHITLLGISVAEAERILVPAFFKNNYAYPGLKETLERFKKTADLVIWTLGHPRFQQFKRSLIPYLADIPFLADEASKVTFPKEIILEGDHATYRGENYKKIIMIDDRPRNFLENPLAYMRQIRVRYPGGRYSAIETPKGVEEVTSLTEIQL